MSSYRKRTRNLHTPRSDALQLTCSLKRIGLLLGSYVTLVEQTARTSKTVLKKKHSLGISSTRGDYFKPSLHNPATQTYYEYKNCPELINKILIFTTSVMKKYIKITVQTFLFMFMMRPKL